MSDINTVEMDFLPLTVVVMAKRAVPGKVKTRLTRGPSALSPEVAAAVHAAMLDTVLHRVRTHLAAATAGRAEYVLAMDDPEGAPDAADGWEVVPQGGGDLGERLERVWSAKGRGPIVFFGVDSPDVPAEALTGIVEALKTSDAAVGPVDDGGYWTLACGRWLPALVQGIDWGTPAVYHQTSRIAAERGLALAELLPWHDVDEPDDLASLVQRLATADEPSLIELRTRLTTNL